jgi:hypothetical protein
LNKRNPAFRPEMAGLSDSLTIGILLILVFGAAAFYLYSRLTQTDKRLSLMENVLLTLKMTTEASMMGPDSVEPVSMPAPLQADDVDDVDEEQYTEMLKHVSVGASSSLAASSSASEEAAAEELLRSIPTPPQSASTSAVTEATVRKMDANYESMSLKELQALAKTRGLSAGAKATKKRELIDFLKRAGAVPDAAPQPLGPQPGDLEVESVEVDGFTIELERSSA